MVIIVDNDDTMHYHNVPFERFLEEVKGIKTSITQYNDFGKNWGMNCNEAIKLLKEFYDSPYGDLQEPIPGMKDILLHYKMVGEKIYVVSARSERQDKSIEAIEKNYSGLIEDILFGGHFLINKNKETKADIAKRLNGTIAFEDAYHHAQHLAKAGIDCFLLDTKWNQNSGKDISGIYRVQDWKEAYDNIR